MTISYTTGIPAASHNPSTDQPDMRTNNDNIKQIIAVDHSTFDAANSGTHNHVTFTSSQINPSLAASQNQIYPKTFGASTTYLETYSAFRPSAGTQVNGYSPLVKVMGRFVTQGPGYPKTLYDSNSPTATQADTLFVNISTIIQSTVGGLGDTITVNFASALPYVNYYVFFEQPVGGGLPSQVQYIKGTTTIVFSGPGFIGAGGATIAFMVI